MRSGATILAAPGQSIGSELCYPALCLCRMQKTTVPYALVVDDDPIIQMNIHDILEDAGFRIYDADNGDVAKDLLHQHAEETVLLFSDVEMPGETDGFALAHHVDKHWPHIEIVIASGRIKPGPDDMPDKATFIGKPFSAQMVHDHLREKLPNGRAGAAEARGLSGWRIPSRFEARQQLAIAAFRFAVRRLRSRSNQA